MKTSMASTHPARYIMIGGFLGAGKTTAVARLGTHLRARNCRVGLITNDQGNDLVDTATLRARGFETEEISGGCFCCRFDSLTAAAEKLSAAARPDAFIAEPVGSCTDLVATVTYPLRRLYGDQFVIAPLSVLVDPIRAGRILGLLDGARFSEKVRYIYQKQLEEADLIVINKIDSIGDDTVQKLRDALRSRFTNAEVLCVSARTEAGLDGWFERLNAEQAQRRTIDIDYTRYADGEALLGWLNATVRIQAAPGKASFDPDPLLERIAASLQTRLSAQNAEIAHLKMTYSPDDGLGALAVLNLVRNDFVPELSQTIGEESRAGQLIVNLRAESDPDLLQAALRDAISRITTDDPAIHPTIDHLEFFQPGKPVPTHRVQVA